MKTDAMKIMSVAVAPPAYEYLQRLAAESGVSVSRYVLQVLERNDPKIASLEKQWLAKRATKKLDGILHVVDKVEVEKIEGDDK